ncbi:MAG: class I SAM-dependent methyltransferase [Acidobacteriota bacterium]
MASRTDAARGVDVPGEIGVWQGAVTCRIREVMAPDALFFAIDPYPAGRLGTNYQRMMAVSEVGRIANGRVEWLQETGRTAAIHPKVVEAAPFDFVFIDADHTYAGLRENWEGWAPLMAPAGVMAIHEGGEEGGVSDHGGIRFCDDVARRDDRFTVLETVENLLVLRRRD